MVQVDPFWAYGFGAGYALAAGNQLRHRARRHRMAPADEATPPFTGGVAEALTNPYLKVALLFTALLFAPTGSYLLWAFPSWETMHVTDGTLPAWLAALFPATNVLLTLVGFLVTEQLLIRGSARLAYLQLLLAYFGFFFVLVNGWDGTGYQRFFSAGRADFEAWAAHPALDNIAAFQGSSVAMALNVIIGATVLVLVATYLWIFHAGIRMSQQQSLGRSALTFTIVFLGGVVLSLGAAIAATVVNHVIGWPAVPLLGGAVAAVVLLPRGIAAAAMRTLVPTGP